MKTIKGNVVTARATGEIDFLLHVANCQGKFASGVAKEIREVFPKAYDAYYNKWQIWGKLELGSISRCGGVVNLHAQKNYGYDGNRYLNYGALASCLSKAYHQIAFLNAGSETTADINIGIPYLMGCDRAGGDWEIVTELVEYYLGDYSVVAYKL